MQWFVVQFDTYNTVTCMLGRLDREFLFDRNRKKSFVSLYYFAWNEILELVYYLCPPLQYAQHILGITAWT